MEIDFKKREHDLILKNQRLVYYLSQKFASHPLYDQDDFASIGMVGLIKAAQTFDISKNIKFATYASRCINNEIFMYLRKNNASVGNLSLDELFYTDKDGNNDLSIIDTISTERSNFVETIVDTKMLEDICNVVLNYLDSRSRLIWLYKIAGTTQTELSNILGISQSYISRLEKKLKKKIKEFNKKKLNFKEVYFMSIKQNSGIIQFTAKDVKNFNLIFSDFLRNRIIQRELSEFKVKRVKDLVMIQLPCDAESFSFIADIIREIDSDYTLHCNPEATLSIETRTISSNLHQEQAKETNDSSISEELTEEDTNSSVSNESQEKDDDASPVSNELHEKDVNDSTTESSIKPSSTREIKDYILSLDQFTTKQIHEKFPENKSSLISVILNEMKNKQIISSVSKGIYKKN